MLDIQTKTRPYWGYHAQYWHSKQHHLSFLLKQWGCRQSRRSQVQVQPTQTESGEEGRSLSKRGTLNFPRWGWIHLDTYHRVLQYDDKHTVHLCCSLICLCSWVCSNCMDIGDGWPLPGIYLDLFPSHLCSSSLELNCYYSVSCCRTQSTFELFAELFACWYYTRSCLLLAVGRSHSMLECEPPGTWKKWDHNLRRQDGKYSRMSQGQEETDPLLTVSCYFLECSTLVRVTHCLLAFHFHSIILYNDWLGLIMTVTLIGACATPRICPTVIADILNVSPGYILLGYR